MFITLLLFASKFFYTLVLGKYGYFSGDLSKMTTLRIMTLALLIVFSLVMLQVPFFSKILTSMHTDLNTYLRTHFQWLADYIFGSPLFYYVYASFKGSDLAEKFSTYRKFI
jgi:hypothetical protein